MTHKGWTLLLTLITTGQLAFGQGSDMIVLRKGTSKTLKTFLPGSQINFISTSGQAFRGTIKKIDKDSLHLNIYFERQNTTIWGTGFWDTASVSTLPFHYRDIREITKPPKGIGVIRNGALFLYGGAAFLFLHLFNAAYLKMPVDPLTAGSAAAVGLAGFGLKKLYRTTIKLGNQYQLHYIPMK